MYILRQMQLCILLIQLNLVYTSSVLATEEAKPGQYPWSWWHEAHGHSFWWIFPLMFFVFMVVIFIFMMRRGGMGCAWRDRMMPRSDFRDAMKPWDQRSESALEILDKRYARGEIEKQEYEEKKAAISLSG